MSHTTQENHYTLAAAGASSVKTHDFAWKIMNRNPGAFYAFHWSKVKCEDRTIHVWVSWTLNEDEEKPERTKPQGFFLCFNIEDRSSFDTLHAIAQDLLTRRNASKLPFTLVGCKNDPEAQRQVSDDDARKFAEMIGAEYVLASLHDHSGVKGALEALVRAVDSNKA